MKPISDTLVTMLNRQIAHETGNELLYRHIASYAHTLGLKGIESYFSSQADGERDHAGWLRDLLNNANIQIAVPAIPEKPNKFSSCEEIAALYIEAEASTTDALEAISRQSDAEYDIAVQSLMQKMLEEQTEEEGSADRFALLVQLSGGDMIKLDLAMR